VNKVFTAHAVSVDGYLSGRTPDGDEEFGRGLGDAPGLFDWYFDGDTPSRLFDGFKLSEPSAAPWVPAGIGRRRIVSSTRSTAARGREPRCTKRAVPYPPR
jgi:hypothetical protein